MTICAAEIVKREIVYTDFVMSASHLLLDAHVREDVALNDHEQRLVGLINRLRLFAPSDVIASAEDVLRNIVDVLLRPRVKLKQLAKEALKDGPPIDPLLPFSVVCRSDLENVSRSMM